MDTVHQTILTLKRLGMPNLLPVQYILTEAVWALPKPLRVTYKHPKPELKGSTTLKPINKLSHVVSGMP